MQIITESLNANRHRTKHPGRHKSSGISDISRVYSMQDEDPFLSPFFTMNKIGPTISEIETQSLKLPHK